MNSPSSPLRTALTTVAETLTMALALATLFWLLPLVAWCAR